MGKGGGGSIYSMCKRGYSSILVLLIPWPPHPTEGRRKRGGGSRFSVMIRAGSTDVR